ncbi:MAG TPA: MFS transporter [Halanaerobiales bacterium]|nr:MFS transporter [Halanaerobiales bacterium]
MREKFNRENANLFLFSSGKLISLFGTAIYTFALGLYLLKATGSGLTFATNLVLYTLPMVLINPLAGVLADRINKKIVVVGSDLLNGIFLLSVYWLASKFGLSVILVYISTFFMTVLAAFFNMGIESAKPNLVRDEKLIKINSMARVIESASHIIGPMFGGLIYAFIDIKLFILINGISFLLAALMEFFINYQFNLKEEDKSNKEKVDLNKKIKNKLWLEMKEGYNYIFSRKHLKALVYIFIALNFFFNFSVIVPLPYLLNTFWEVDSTIYGIVQGAFPVGMIMGALLVNKIIKKISYSKLLKRISYSTGFGVIAFGFPLIIFADNPGQNFILIYYTILMLMSGIVVSWVDIPANVLLQRMVPGRILGRVISVKLSIVKLIVPISLIISGYLVNIISPLYLFIGGSLIFLIFNFWFFPSGIGKKFISVSNENIGVVKKAN